jgi:hypothetical protein
MALDPNIIALEILAQLATTPPPMDQAEATAAAETIWTNINTALIKYYTGSVIALYKRSAGIPTTPIGDTPAGWSISIPGGADPLYLSIGTKNAVSSLIDTWSTAVPVGGGGTSGTPYYSGFVNYYNDTSLIFVPGTRTFSILPTGSTFTVYVQANAYAKSTETLVISDVEGNHLIYYNGSGTLVESVNYTTSQAYTIIKTYAVVSYIYWDATNSRASIGPLREQHGIYMDGDTHAYLHANLRTRWRSGLGLSSIIVDDTGNLASHAQWATDLGEIQDEDLIHSISAITSTTGYKIFYNSGVTSSLRYNTNATFGVLTTGSGRLAYNNINAGGSGIWGLSEVSNNDFCLYHVFATNDSSNPVISVMGQGIYTTLANARTGANTELANLLLSFPAPEFKALGTIIFQTSTSYGNAVKARIRSTDTGATYIDWRKDQTGNTISSPTDHNGLTNLQLSQAGVTYGHINDQAQTLAGQKTFSSAPIISTGTADRAVVTGASKELATVNVTSTELGYVAGATSNIQAQINSIGGVSNPTYSLIDANGVVISGAYVNTGDVIAKWNSSNQICKADKRYSNRAEVLGFASTGASIGNSVICLKTGFIIKGTWSLTIGSPCYLGNDGDVTQDTALITEGQQRVYLGTAVTATQISISIDEASEVDQIYDDSNGYYFPNSHFEITLDGWSTYNDGASATPVDGTGGSVSNLVLTRSTSSPLIGSASGVFSKSSANIQGMGASYDFAIDAGVAGNTHKFSFIYTTSGSYVSNDVGVYIYDKTNSRFIVCNNVNIVVSNSINTIFECLFTSSVNTRDLRFILHTQTTSALAYDIKFDNIEVKNYINNQYVAPIGNWTSYTPTLGGSAGTISNVAQWRRVGSSMEVRGQVTFSSAGSTTFVVYVPAGYTPDMGNYTDLSTNPFILGVATWYDAGSSFNTGYFSPKLAGSGGTGIAFGSLGSNVLSASGFANGDVFTYNFSVPISQWTSNVNLISDFTEYSSNSGMGASTDTTSFAYGQDGSPFPTATYPVNGYTKQVRFQRPLLPTDLLVLEMRYDTSGQWQRVDTIAGVSMRDNICYNTKVNSTDINILFRQYAYNTTNWYSDSALQNSRWRVRKISNGNMAEVPALVYAKYSNGTATFITSNLVIVNYDTKVEDTHNAVTVGASWKFTAPYSGLYSIQASVVTGIVNAALVGYQYFSALVKNGTTYMYETKKYVTVAGNDVYSFPLSKTIRLLAGDYIDVEIYKNDTASASLSGVYNEISITRIGN